MGIRRILAIGAIILFSSSPSYSPKTRVINWEDFEAGRRVGYAEATPKGVVVDYDFYTVRGVTVELGNGETRQLRQNGNPVRNLEGVQEFVLPTDSNEVSRGYN